MQAIGSANSVFVTYRAFNRLATIAACQHRIAFPAATRAFCVTLRKPFTNSLNTRFPVDMDGKGQGAWGAWNVEPSKFTRVVADSMKELYVT
jgi:hypothetical protein